MTKSGLILGPIVFGQTIACGRYHFISVAHGSLFGASGGDVAITG